MLGVSPQKQHYPVEFNDPNFKKHINPITSSGIHVLDHAGSLYRAVGPPQFGSRRFRKLRKINQAIPGGVGVPVLRFNQPGRSVRRLSVSGAQTAPDKNQNATHGADKLLTNHIRTRSPSEAFKTSVQ